MTAFRNAGLPAIGAYVAPLHGGDLVDRARGARQDGELPVVVEEGADRRVHDRFPALAAGGGLFVEGEDRIVGGYKRVWCEGTVTWMRAQDVEDMACAPSARLSGGAEAEGRSCQLDRALPKVRRPAGTTRPEMGTSGGDWRDRHGLCCMPSPMRSFSSLVLAFAVVWALAFAPRDAWAQSTPSVSGILGTVQRCEPPASGSTCVSADNTGANPHPSGVLVNTINFEDCAADLFYQFEVGISNPSSSYTLQAWAGTQDCLAAHEPADIRHLGLLARCRPRVRAHEPDPGRRANGGYRLRRLHDDAPHVLRIRQRPTRATRASASHARTQTGAHERHRLFRFFVDGRVESRSGPSSNTPSPLTQERETFRGPSRSASATRSSSSTSRRRPILTPKAGTSTATHPPDRNPPPRPSP